MSIRVIIPGHRYMIERDGCRQSLQFIEKGPSANGDLNHLQSGATTEDIIDVLVDRLETLNKAVPCRENSHAVTKLQEARLWLEERTRKRVAQGVEGTAAKHIDHAAPPAEPDNDKIARLAMYEELNRIASIDNVIRHIDTQYKGKIETMGDLVRFQDGTEIRINKIFVTNANCGFTPEEAGKEFAGKIAGNINLSRTSHFAADVHYQPGPNGGYAVFYGAKHRRKSKVKS